MDIQNLYEIINTYQLISENLNNYYNRKKLLLSRKKAIKQFSNKNLIKIAFDTRRIDQEESFNPRRGLQHYNRSNEFITKSIENKLINLAKLKNILDEIKISYGNEPQWLDSNARILLNTVNNGLRDNFKDGEYTEVQPSTGSLNYIEELLDARYRLKIDNISKLSENDIKGIILNKDEDLAKRNISSIVHGNREVTKNDIVNKSYNELIEALFGGVKATKDGKTVERTVTITIKDSVLDKE